MRIYSLRVLIAFDQLINTIAGGYPNETLSARAWRLGGMGGHRVWRGIQQVTDYAFSPYHENHCEDSFWYIHDKAKSCGLYLPTHPHFVSRGENMVADQPVIIDNWWVEPA